MNIDQGLFRLEFADHHAILGIPIDADPKEARKRYLKIARRLHPDSLLAASEDEKQQASELLSKLVNPAYETLSQEKAATEHAVVLRLRGQQLMQQAETIELSLETARALMLSNNIDYAYTTAVKALAEKQYEDLDEVLAITGQISELNLVYVTRKAGAPAVAAQSAPAQPAADTAQSAPAASAPAPSAPRRYRETILEGYLNRARELEQKKDYPKAIIELREALRAYPNSAVCHSRLANVYLKAGQSTMARVHATRALEINAGDEVAQRIQKHLEKTAPRDGTGSGDSGDKPRGGLFGLFGGKKK
ncbi:MAG: DnaJ domain-containing protein [Cyanobacteria bacterium Co-bin8]|nr:DnaJ domain-containing protein [Cyanobacteria bacterium Co-bin8]